MKQNDDYMTSYFINNNINEEEGGGEAVAPMTSTTNTTSDMVVHKGKVGKIIKRRKPKMKKNDFSTIDIKENKLTKSEYEMYHNTNSRVIVPLDEDGIEYKLLNFDDYGRVYENVIIVNRVDKKIYIEANSKETINYLLMESNRSKYNTMRLPEMKHIHTLVKSLVESYNYCLMFSNTEYQIKF